MRHLLLSLSPAVTFLPGAGRICPGRGKSFLKGRGLGKEMNLAWTAKGSHFGGAGEQSETERASPLIFLVLLLHSGALVHLIQLHSAGLGIGAGHIRGDYAVAV